LRRDDNFNGAGLVIVVLHVVISPSQQSAAFAVDLVAMCRKDHPRPLLFYNLSGATKHGHFAAFDVDLEKIGRRKSA
jgi:hypothetical protein